MDKGTKIEIRNNCRICGKPITQKRFRTYCSGECRDRNSTIENRAYRLEWQRKKIGKYAPGKLKCPICGMYYNKLGSHVYNSHNMTAKEFKKKHNLLKTRGLLSEKSYQNIRQHAYDKDGKLAPHVKEALLVKGIPTRLDGSQHRVKGVKDQRTFEEFENNEEHVRFNNIK